MSERKQLKSSQCSPVPGRQPLCLTLAGARFGLQTCFNWGRGQNGEDAQHSPSVCVSVTDSAEVEIVYPTQSAAGGRIRRDHPRKSSRRKSRQRGQQPQHERGAGAGRTAGLSARSRPRGRSPQVMARHGVTGGWGRGWFPGSGAGGGRAFCVSGRTARQSSRQRGALAVPRWETAQRNSLGRRCFFHSFRALV